MTDVVLAENVALLHLLHYVPDSPTSISDKGRQGLDDDAAEGRSLPIERERSLGGALALLSSIRDDTNRITAVALQEDRQAGDLRVLIAANHSTSPTNSGYLKEIVTGFEPIFDALSRASRAPDPKLEEEILFAVVAMCKERIRSRLHFKPNPRGKKEQARGKEKGGEGVMMKKGKPKKPMVERIARVSRPVQLHMDQLRLCGLEQSGQAFLEASKAFTVQLKMYTKHQTNERLVRIVKEASQWAREESAKNIFKKISPRTLDASEARALMETVTKVGQYQSAARHLYRSARKFAIIRRMRPVSIPTTPVGFSELPSEDYRPSLVGALSRIRHKPNQAGAAAEVCRLLGKNVEGAQESFESTVLRSLREAKVHAEVQILAHLETFPLAGPAPRFVRSSKKACFLCNELLKTQKRVLTPHSHGRLYPGWRLPPVPALNGLQDRFNAVLETRARDSVQQLLRSRKRVKHPDPSESSALSAIHSSTTAPSVVPSLSFKEADEVVREVGHQLDTKEDAGTQESSSVISVASKESSSDNAGASSIELVAARGLPGSLPSNHASPLYYAGMLEIQLEYEAALNRDSSRHLTYEIKMLGGDEARIIRENPATATYDASCMDPGSQVDVSKREPIYIALRDGLVELTLRN